MQTKDTNNYLRFEFCNARSICNKLRPLSHYLLSRNDLDLLFLTETWLNPMYTDTMVCPNGYNIMRLDRSSRKGGGVLVLYKSGLQVHRVDVKIQPNSNFELVCIDLYMRNFFIRFCCIYLPPASCFPLSTRPLDVMVNLCNTLTPLLLTDNPVLMFGDFNLPHFDWSIPSTIDSGDRYHDIFLDFCSSNSLLQLIEFPTHDKGNTLDLLLCNYAAKDTVINTRSCAPPWVTDHFLISSVLAFNNPDIPTPVQKRPNLPNFNKANYAKISNILLNTNWDFLEASNSFQSKYDQFCAVLTSVINSNIPLIPDRPKYSRKPPLHIKKLLKNKHDLYYKSKADSTSKSDYKEASKAYDSAVNRWHDSFESKLCENPNVKKLYGFVNTKLKSKFSIPPIETEDNTLIFSDLEKSNLFNETFQTFFTVDNNSQFSSSPPEHIMPFSTILPEDILRACKKMKKKLSRTPEDIPSIFIVNNINALLLPLTIIFNLSLASNSIPTQWKQAFIVPIFKKGDRSKIGNYRPISLTSSFSRLFETILLDKMLLYILNNNLISEHQFGFLPNRSACSNLLTSLNSWLHSYEAFESVSVLYTDIKKAFDSVNHRILIKVLQSYGINARMVSWIENFLSNRSQQVCINASTSSSLSVLSGVPQGSVIGPFLFLLFYDDVTKCTSPEVSINLFADDSKLYSSIPRSLQMSINTMDVWLSERQLHLAPQKCVILKIKKSAILDNSEFTIHNHLVNENSQVKDLGVYISQNLTWSPHIDHICHSAAVTSYQLRKIIKSKNIWTWVKIFTTYIRPKVEYCTPVWSPYLLKDKDKVEDIQRHYTKTAFQKCNIPFSSYEDRLSKIGFMKLCKRREYFDMILLYRTFYRTSDLVFEDYFTLVPSHYSLRSHSLRIEQKQKFSSSQGFYSFFSRAPPIWNKLPENIVKAQTLGVFKRLIKQHFKSQTP